MADVTISGLSLGSPSKNSAIIPYSDGTTTLRTAPSGIVAASPGCILQVKQAVKADVQSHYTDIFTDITNLTVDITPKTLTSTFMLMGTISMCCGVSQAPVFRFLRNGTPIGVGTAEGLRFAATTWSHGGVSYYMHSVPINYLDNSSINNLNSIQYKIQTRLNNADNGQGVWINTYMGDTNQSNIARCISTLTVMEIAG